MADLKLKHLEDQLKRIGCNFRFWGRAELKELANVLLPGEVVEHCVNGTYEGGFAMLAATDQRVLLIDKKPLYLTLEDIRFDMIAEVDYNHRMLNATVFIVTPSKALRFMAYNHARLRKLFHFVQTRVMEVRQHYQQQAHGVPSQAMQAPAPQNYAQPEFGPYLQQQIAPAGQPQAVQPQQQFQSPMGYRRTVAPIISAYTRLPIMSRQRRFLGSRAMNTPMPSIYNQDTTPTLS